MLTRLLTAKDDRFTGDQTARRALLSFRLGHARAQRGDIRQAAPAYERAIALAPGSEGAVSARRGLVELARATEQTDASREAIAEHLQMITASTGLLADLVAWADELRKVQRPDAARMALELAIACGHPPDVHQSAFLQVHKAYAMRDDESYRASLESADHNLIDPEALALGPVATALFDAAPMLWPDLDQALARAGVPGARRIPATLHVPATAMFPRLTTALGTGAVNLYQVDEGPDVTVVASATPTIVIGPRLTSEATPQPEVRALLARAVTLLRPEHLAFAGLPAAEAARLTVSIARLFGPPALRDATAPLVDDPDIQRGHDELVKGALSVKIRTALLLDGEPAVVVRHAAGHTHLIRAIAHPAWLALRGRLGLGVR